MTLHPSARPLAAAAAGLLLLTGCGGDDSAGGEDGVSVQDVTEQPGLDYDAMGDVVADGDQYIGQEVMVSGEVSAQINDRMFHIASEPGSNGLLVVSEEPIVGRLETDTVVEVVGTVREVDPSTFETEFGLPYDEDYDSFGGRHAILASSVEIVGAVDDEIDGPTDDGQGEGIADEDGVDSFGEEDAPDEGNDGLDR